MLEWWKNIPLWCVIASLLTSAVCSVLPERAARRLSLGVVLASTALQACLLANLIPYGESYVYTMGHFSAPWGNEFRAGVLEALSALSLEVILLLSLVGGLTRIREQVASDRQNLYWTVIALVQTALLAMIYTNDCFTAYVFIEIMTIGACTLITARTKGRTLVAATRYMIMNLLGSGLFLLGLVMLYGLTGHLLMSNMQEGIRKIVEHGEYTQPLTVVLILMTMGLCIKSALFPFHTWLPDAYGYSTPSSSAILSSVVSKCYIFLLIKVIYRVIGFEFYASTHITDLLLLFGCAGIIMGSVSALREKDIRRMISFSSVAQIGYIYMGIGLGTAAGMQAAVFHIYAHAAAKAMLFLASSGLSRVSGESKMFRDLRGAGIRYPVAGVAFVVGALSMVGIPFMGGFISKLNFSIAAMDMSQRKMLLVLFVLVVSTTLNTIYFLKTVITIYRPSLHPEFDAIHVHWHENKAATLGMACFLVLNLLLGVASRPILSAISQGLKMFS